jgi:tRNA threonylcarbamoyl adenosine modification protein YeaZ
MTPDSLPKPRILAIDTSGRQGSIALAEGTTLLALRHLPENNRHALELMPAIAELTREYRWLPNDLDHLYLSIGPGSFTGLRIATAIARSLAHASAGKLQLVAVPSLDVIAHNAPPEFSYVLPILDAKRGQVFSARYHRPPPPAAGILERTTEAALVHPAAFLAETLALAAGAPVAVLGEGVDYHRATLSGATELDRTLWAGRADIVHRLGYTLAQQQCFTKPHALLPTYIRLPEAEEVWQKKNAPATTTF